MGRIPIRAGLRFRVMSRDNFTCQYCGRSAPFVSLVVDHIHPVARGGTNDINNLTTACYDCNSGKSDKLLKKRVLHDDSALIKYLSDRSLIVNKRTDILLNARLLYKETYNTDIYLNQFEYLFNTLWEYSQFKEEPMFAFSYKIMSFITQNDSPEALLDNMEFWISKKQNRILTKKMDY